MNKVKKLNKKRLLMNRIKKFSQLLILIMVEKMKIIVGVNNLMMLKSQYKFKMD